MGKAKTKPKSMLFNFKSDFPTKSIGSSVLLSPLSLPLNSQQSITGGGGSTAEMTSVAVAVNGSIGGDGGNGSRRAVRWAVENLLPQADRFILIHVMPTITSIPTPSGVRISVSEMDVNLVEMYMKDMKVEFEEVFVPFKKLCKTIKMETLVLEGDNPATALLTYISDSGIKNLVLGSCSSNCITRKLKGPGIPTTILRYAPETCDIYVISRNRVITKSANPSSISETSSRHWMFKQREVKGEPTRTFQQKSKFNPSSVDSEDDAFSMSEVSYPISQGYTYKGSNASVDQERDGQMFGLESMTVQQRTSTTSSNIEESDVQGEIEQLRLELQDTVGMYRRACEELALSQTKINLLTLECRDESSKVDTALEREETMRKIAAREKEKCLDAVKDVELARDLLAIETLDRQIAEVTALKESLERQKLVNAVFSRDRRYRKYSRNEIEVATNFFSETKEIGEGGFGKVYKCSLDHTPVAIKVLHSDASQRKEEFLREVEVLSYLRHPHMVSLVGACPESCCLVYEYMENGSLEDHIFVRNGKPPLPWYVRFRIAFEVACGLTFLHNSKPEPIVHRDLKPGNILLDRNYVSKIGDVGLAKLISDAVPDDITQYKDSIIAGTLYYMDPEYLRTGTIRPKSDLYAFGVIILQLLTGRQPNGLILTVEKSITKGSFVDKLDKLVTDWPLAETEELARLALGCCQLRCRDRPDLDIEVLPVLKRLADIADANVKLERNNISAPSHYFCPILQEVMEDPFIADDGFTYEHRAIQAWLEKHNVSPVTKQRMKHTVLTPNHTLRSAIQEWRSRVTFS